MTTHRVHLGHNIRRLREIQGIKQEVLARALGTGWSQKKVSLLEGRAHIEEGLLEQVAAALGLSAQAIEEFSETALTECIHFPHLLQVTKEQLAAIEKQVALLEENRALYQRLLQAEEEKRVLLEQLHLFGSGQCTSLRLVKEQ